jgi:4-hydroxyphenylpyruvate dioxygenase-like putative hemolysin
VGFKSKILMIEGATTICTWNRVPIVINAHKAASAKDFRNQNKICINKRKIFRGIKNSCQWKGD